MKWQPRDSHGPPSGTVATVQGSAIPSSTASASHNSLPPQLDYSRDPALGITKAKRRQAQ